MVHVNMIRAMAMFAVGASASASGGSFPDMCGIGYSQSPISLDRCTENNGHENKFMYPVERDALTVAFGSGSSKLELIALDGGKVLKISPNTPGEMGTFSVESHGSTKSYRLKYCLVYRDSDHTIALADNGIGRYPAEVQCFGDMTGGTEDHPVHRVGALSVMYMSGQTEDAEGETAETSNEFFAQFAGLEKMPTEDEAQTDITIDFNGVEGSAGLTRYWTYSGSERLPPCAENVDWYVMYDPAGISAAQLEMLSTAGISAPPKHMAHHNGRHPDGCPVYHAGAASASLTSLLLVAAFVFGRP